MKTFNILILLLTLTISSQAQDYKPFQLHLGIGQAAHIDGGGGVLLAIEPAYRLSDDVALGIKGEFIGTNREVPDIDIEFGWINSYTANIKFYLTDSEFRPFFGVGGGVYLLKNLDYSTEEGEVLIDLGNVAGFYPRIGFDYKHFSFNVDYNFIEGEASVPTGNRNYQVVNSSFIGFRVGGFLFGGKR